MGPEAGRLGTTCVAMLGGGRYMFGTTGPEEPDGRGLGPDGAVADGLVREQGVPPPKTGMGVLGEACAPVADDGGGNPKAGGSPELNGEGQLGGGIDDTNGHPGMFGIDVCGTIPPTN